MGELELLRTKIEEIDNKIIELIEQRLAVSTAIGEYKKAHNLPVYDASREEELKTKNISKVRPEYQKAYVAIFETILKTSKDQQL